MSRPLVRFLLNSKNSARHRLSVPFALLLLALGLVGLVRGTDAAARAEAPPAAPQADAAEPTRTGLVERSRVQLGLLEVVVLDRRGRHVRGVPASAFRLTLGGEPVPVLSVDEVDIARGPDRPGAEPPARKPESTSIEPEVPQPGPTDPAEPEPFPEARAKIEQHREAVEQRLQGPRWFVIILDGYNNVSPLRISQARRSAKNWLYTNLRPMDQVAIYEFNPFLNSVSGFSADRARIEDAIDQARIFPGSDMGQEMIAQRLEQGDALSRDFLQQQLINAGNFGSDLMRAERDRFYMNMSSIAGVMGGLPGTKAVLLFSGGFPLTRSRETAASGGFTPRFKEMLNWLEQFGIRVFTFDVGQEGGFTDASTETNFRLELDRLGLGTTWMDDLQIGAQLDATNAHHEILVALGGETGGRFWRGRDFKAGLKAADDDLSHYYLVGYEPVSQSDSSRRYRSLRVKLDGLNYKVVARRGNFSAPPVEPAPEPIVSPVPVREPVAADPPAKPAALDVICRPQFYPAGDQTLVVLPIQVRGPVEPQRLGPQGSALDIDVSVQAQVAGQTIRDGVRNIRAGFTPAQTELLKHGFGLREAILVAPGIEAEVSVTLKLNGLSVSGQWRSTLEVPRPNEGFGLTSLTLLNPTDPKPQLYDVFLAEHPVHGTQPPQALPDPLGAAVGRPPIHLEGGFSKASPLLAQVQVTAPPPARSDRRSPLSMDWELLPVSQGAPIAPPVQYRRLQLQDRNQVLDVLVDLDIAAVTPGEYTLRLTARNLDDQVSDVRSVPVTILP